MTAAPPDPDRLRARNGRGFAELAVQLALTAAAVSCVWSPSPWIFWPGQVLLALVILRWFFFLHGCGHRTVFATRRMNDVAGALASIFCLVPYNPWRVIHIRHHQFTGRPGKDPTAVDPEKLKLVPAWHWTVIDRLWRWHVPVFSPLFLLTTFWNVPKADAAMRSPRARRLNRASMLLIVGAHAAALAAIGPSYLLRVLPALAIVLVISDPILLAQHVGLPFEEPPANPDRAVPVADQDALTRSLKFPAFAERWFFLSFNRHSVHHTRPHVPHYDIATVTDVPEHEMDWRDWLREAKRRPIRELFLAQDPVV